MGHRLSIGADGIAEMAYAGRTPWHGLGTPVPDAMTAEEALKAARLDWSVVEQPSAFKNADGTYVDIPSHKALLRSDNRTVLHVARSSYEPFQNREAFEFADAIVGTGDAKYVTAGAIDGGRKVWMLAELTRCPVMVAGDDVRPYFLLYNSHDGTSKVRGILTPTRVVCWNTLSAAIGNAKASEGFSLRHTKNVRDNADDARKALGLVMKGYEDLGERFSFLASKSYTESAIREYAENLIPLPKSGGDRALDNTRARRSLIVKLAEEGKGNGRIGVRGTWWAAYNGATELLDHVGGWRTAENRMKSVIFGNRATEKARALSVAMEYANK